MSSGTVPVSDRGDIREHGDAINRVVYRDNGTETAQVIWRNDSASYILDADNASGNHANFGSGKLLVQDSGVTFSAVAKFADGAAGTPSITFSSNTGDGIYWGGAGRVGISAGAAKIVEIVNSGGTVGVGIGMSPSVPLDVQRSSTDYVSRIEQTGSSAGAKVLSLKTASTSGADSVLEALSGSTALFKVWADGSAQVGTTHNVGAGVLTIGGPLYLTGSSIFPLNRKSISSTATATTLNPAYSGAPLAGFMFIRNSNGNVAGFQLEAAATVLAFGNAAVWAGGSALTAGRISLFISGGALQLRNDSGSSQSFEILAWG